MVRVRRRRGDEVPQAAGRVARLSRGAPVHGDHGNYTTAPAEGSGAAEWLEQVYITEGDAEGAFDNIGHDFFATQNAARKDEDVMTAAALTSPCCEKLSQDLQDRRGLKGMRCSRGGGQGHSLLPVTWLTFYVDSMAPASKKSGDKGWHHPGSRKHLFPLPLDLGR